MTRSIKERTLLNRVERYFRNKNFQTCKEVPLLDNSIDLVAYDNKFSKIIAVEVKVANWKRALQQAMLYQLCAHQVYVALWSNSLNKINLNNFNELGIGLISVDGTARKITNPRRSYIIHKSLMKNVKNYIKKGE